jgi:hypothetical protein
MAIEAIACIDLPSAEPPCITMPGGATICATWPFPSPPSADALMRQMMAQLQSALAPLAPLFTALDIISIIINLLKALAKIDLPAIAEEAAKLPEAVVKLLAILPQVAIPLMLVGFLDIIILFLVGFNEYLTKTSQALDRLTASVEYQDTLGASALIDAALCGQVNLDDFMASASAGMDPVNSIINAINIMLELIGLGKFKIPTLGEVTTANIAPFQAILQETAEFLQLIRNAIPF